jgi:hypothetical protein
LFAKALKNNGILPSDGAPTIRLRAPTCLLLRKSCSILRLYYVIYMSYIIQFFKEIVSPDWKGLHMFSYGRNLL